MTRALFAVKIGDEDWREVLITEDPAKIPAARIWAEANGFDRLREVVINDTVPPDFGAAVNV